jgi:hypothetical protein
MMLSSDEISKTSKIARLAISPGGIRKPLIFLALGGIA